MNATAVSLWISTMASSAAPATVPPLCLCPAGIVAAKVTGSRSPGNSLIASAGGGEVSETAIYISYAWVTLCAVVALLTHLYHERKR